ncbi:MAG: hypothetical protein IJC16_07100 [Rikenellaceae bacterium]|nr:hypothetical protein [Rikenellaceae bacterium]
MQHKGSTDHRRRLRKALRTSAGIIVALGTLYLGADIWVTHKVKRLVAEESEKLSHGMLRTTVEGVGINPFNLSVTLRGIAVRSDSAALAARMPSIGALNLDIARLRIRGIRRSKAPGDHTIAVAALRITSPRLSLVRNIAAAPPAADPAGARPDTAQVPLSPPRVEIGLFTLQDGAVSLCEHRDTATLCHKVGGLTLRTENFVFDAASALTAGGLAAAELTATVNHIAYSFDRGAMTLEIDTLAVSTRDSLVELGGVRLLPQYPKATFAANAPRHADWTQVIAGSVRLTGIDFGAMASHRYLIDSVRIADIEVASYKNRQIAQPERVKQLLFQSVQRLPRPVAVRRIRLDNIRATYEELPAAGSAAGTVTFDSLNGDFYGLTNIPSPGQPFYTLEASGRLMGQGTLSATFELPVEASTNHFEVSGTLGPMEMQALNPTLVPLAGARVTSGRINGMDFRIAGSERQSSVTLQLRYDDLGVTVVRDTGDSLHARPVLTFLVDDLLLHHSNPDNHGLRTGTGTAERDPQRSQFNYLWKSLLPGIKSTLIGRDRNRDAGTDRDKRKAERRRLF